MKTFITLEDIGRFRPMAQEIAFERIAPFILEAQFQDIRPILGAPLYHSFKQKFDVSTDPLYSIYQELLVGKVYTYSGVEYAYEGLIPCLAYFSLARFAQHNPVHFTQSGTVIKNNADYSTPLDSTQMKALVSDLRAAAIGYQEMVELFLQHNASTYTLYQVTEPFNQGGVKFFDSDKNFNSSNYYGGNQR